MATEPRRRLFTVDEYYRMGDVGIFNGNNRVELIDGEIVEMSPIGSPHAAVVDRLNVLLQPLLRARAIVRVQNPIRLDVYSEPQPDLSILKFRTDFYRSAHPTPADILLVVEVADTSLRYDRQIKIPLYAGAGIPEVWLVDVDAEQIEVFTHPPASPDRAEQVERAQGYREKRQVRRGEQIRSDALFGANLEVDEILGRE